MSEKHLYESPFRHRYASHEMLHIFSDDFKYSTWRRLWLSLAKAEKALGLPITSEQIAELEAAIHNQTAQSIDYSLVSSYEKEMGHDVMAHLHALGAICPKAKPILHLGSTSAYVTDNTDIIQMRAAFILIKQKLKKLIKALIQFSDTFKALPCLSFTHLQPAQPTTVGKRATLWLQDFVLDLQDIAYRQETLSFLGLKGASGTQCSYLSLFNGDHDKVKSLEELVAKDLEFAKVLPISGQTYTRKQDVHCLNVLSGIAISAHKCATDLRLLAHLREVEEPFEKAQVGSSAMPHKRNPILAERICSLSRFVISLSDNTSYTAATQWLERSLDDSANKRIVIPESFLATDALLDLMIHVGSGLVVYPKVIETHLKEELPFLLTEEILLEGVKRGGDRQVLHEALRIHSQKASNAVKTEGKPNILLDLISKDPIFNLSQDDLHHLTHKAYQAGRAEEQVSDYLQFLSKNNLISE